MQDTSTTPRKVPVQKRSKEKVEQILTAAVCLLEESGIEGVTALNIAKQANIAVASIYQYFPNVNSVMVSLYYRWLEEFLKIFDRIEAEYFLQVSVDDYFRRLGDAFFQESVFSKKAEAELFRASDTLPSLRPVDRQHSFAVASRIKFYLKGYGSQWPDKKLMQLGLYLYKMVVTLQRCETEQSRAEAYQFKQWGESTLIPLLKSALI